MINPNKRMMVAPPMAQVVHTMLAQALFVPPSLSASSREKVPRLEHEPRYERSSWPDRDWTP